MHPEGAGDRIPSEGLDAPGVVVRSRGIVVSTRVVRSGPVVGPTA